MFELDFGSNWNVSAEAKHEIPDTDAGGAVKKRLEELMSAADRSICLINPQEHINPQSIKPSSWDVLDRALHNDEELSGRILDVLQSAKSSMESPRQQCRELRDIASFLSLLSYRMQQGEMAEGDQKLLKDFVLEIDKVASCFFQATAPRWSTHLDKLTAVIRDEIQGQKKLPTVPSMLMTHQGIPVNDKTFAHIHGEAIIKGSSLEGSADGPILAYVKKFLMDYEANYLGNGHESKEVVEELPSLIKMFSDASNLVTVAALDTPIKSHSSLNNPGSQFYKIFRQRCKAYETTLTEVVNGLKPGERTLIPMG